MTLLASVFECPMPGTVSQIKGDLMLDENGRIGFCEDLLQLADSFVAELPSELDSEERVLAKVFALLVMRAELDATLGEISKSGLFGRQDPGVFLAQAGMEVETVSQSILTDLTGLLVRHGLLDT